MKSLGSIRARLANLLAETIRSTSTDAGKTSEEMIREAQALVDELAAVGIFPRASLGSDEGDVARALAELNGATP
jgi:hypothetical protein